MSFIDLSGDYDLRIDSLRDSIPLVRINLRLVWLLELFILTMFKANRAEFEPLMNKKGTGLQISDGKLIDMLVVKGFHGETVGRLIRYRNGCVHGGLFYQKDILNSLIRDNKDGLNQIMNYCSIYVDLTNDSY